MLTTFSHHLTLGSCHGQICHSIILVKVSYCFLMLFSFKMSYWEVLSDFQSLCFWHFPKTCCLPPKLLKNAYFLKKLSIAMEKIPQIFLKLKLLKSRDQNDSDVNVLFCWRTCKTYLCHKNKPFFKLVVFF